MSTPPCDCCGRRAFIVGVWHSVHGAARLLCGHCARLLALDERIEGPAGALADEEATR